MNHNLHSKVFLCLLFVFFFALKIHAQISITPDNSDPDPSAMLDIQSTDKGILVPRMTTAQRTAITNTATGLLVFDLTTESFWFYDGTAWNNLSADVSSGYNTSLVLNGTNLETTDGNGTITTDLSSLQDADWLRTNGSIPSGIGQEIYRTGNLGIGANAANPAFPIDVRGTEGERLRAYSEDNYYAGYLAKNSTREFFMGVQGTFETNDASSGFHIYDNTANARRFVIDKDGDIGIGASNPNAKLHVNGDVRIVDGTQGVDKILTSDAQGFASWADLPNLTVSDNYSFPSADGTSGQVLETDGAGVLTWADKDDSWVSANGSIYSTGTQNVGIGTNLPNTKLNVVGTFRTALTSFPSGYIDISNDADYGYLDYVPYFSSSIGDFKIRVDGTESIHIKPNGNVGIGTTPNANKLTVGGNFETTGDIEFGAANQNPIGYDRKTTMVSGKVNSDGTHNSSVTSSSSIDSTTRLSLGNYVITFAPGTFIEEPIITVTPFLDGNQIRFAFIETISSGSVQIEIRDENNSLEDADFNFIAIGER